MQPFLSRWERQNEEIWSEIREDESLLTCRECAGWRETIGFGTSGEAGRTSSLPPLARWVSFPCEFSYAQLFICNMNHRLDLLVRGLESRTYPMDVGSFFCGSDYCLSVKFSFDSFTKLGLRVDLRLVACLTSSNMLGCGWKLKSLSFF